MSFIYIHICNIYKYIGSHGSCSAFQWQHNYSTLSKWRLLVSLTISSFIDMEMIISSYIILLSWVFIVLTVMEMSVLSRENHYLYLSSSSFLLANKHLALSYCFLPCYRRSTITAFLTSISLFCCVGDRMTLTRSFRKSNSGLIIFLFSLE